MCHSCASTDAHRGSFAGVSGQSSCHQLGHDQPVCLSANITLPTDASYNPLHSQPSVSARFSEQFSPSRCNYRSRCRPAQLLSEWGDHQNSGRCHFTCLAYVTILGYDRACYLKAKDSPPYASLYYYCTEVLVHAIVDCGFSAVVQ